MRRTSRISLLVGVCLLGVFSSRPLSAQACKDDEMMANESKKTLAELVETVKKETFQDFQRAYHRKSCQNKLNFCLTTVNGVLSCLDKALQDPTAEKEDLDAYKAKKAKYSKRKERIEQDRKALIDATENKDAKAVIEKFDVSD